MKMSRKSRKTKKKKKVGGRREGNNKQGQNTIIGKGRLCNVPGEPQTPFGNTLTALKGSEEGRCLAGVWELSRPY